jgi:hypothetical protein
MIAVFAKYNSFAEKAVMRRVAGKEAVKRKLGQRSRRTPQIGFGGMGKFSFRDN